jgi:hypothetical protein
MSFDAETLYNLLPATYRVRDDEQGGPLRALVEVIAREALALEENLAQLYDDMFIETCADWVAPYIGDLIGYRALNSVVPKIASPRAEIANTIGYRRRKGTAAMLEQLARDVTGYPTRVVEFFQLLATTQYMSHIRRDHHVTPDLRQWEPLERVGTPFDSIPRTADVRRIVSGRGKYNIPNIGMFLYRLRAYPLTFSPAFRLDKRRFLFSPLGNSTPLYTLPQSETTITQLAGPLHVPLPISRRVLDARLTDYYGPGLSIAVFREGALVPLEDLVVCDLSDVGGGWAHQPAEKVAIDPELGRLAFPTNADPPGVVRVSFHYGFSADIGGGEYERAATFDELLRPVQPLAMPDSLQSGIDALGGAGALEIGDSGRYEETPSVSVSSGALIEIRAANERRPTIVRGGDWAIDGGSEADLTLNGLLIAGGALRISGELRTLRLRHCTLVPGLTLNGDGMPASPDAASLIVVTPSVKVVIESCVLGAIRAVDGAQIEIINSIVDATSEDRVAYAGLDGIAPGAPLTLTNSTVVGRVRANMIELASNTIFLGRAIPEGEWTEPVRAERRQEGCLRFSFIPLGSRTPRRHQCQPAEDADAARVRPQLTSPRYGDPGYGQLSLRCAREIREGADDGSEIGAFHDMFQPQREANLRVRLDEYLRFGLEAGIFYAS